MLKCSKCLLHEKNDKELTELGECIFDQVLIAGIVGIGLDPWCRLYALCLLHTTRVAILSLMVAKRF
jgi:hypothetical protein